MRTRNWKADNESDFSPGYSGIGHIGFRREGPPGSRRSEECLWRSSGPSTRCDPIRAAKRRAATACIPRDSWCGGLRVVTGRPASSVTVSADCGRCRAEPPAAVSRMSGAAREERAATVNRLSASSLDSGLTWRAFHSRRHGAKNQRAGRNSDGAAGVESASARHSGCRLAECVAQLDQWHVAGGNQTTVGL